MEFLAQASPPDAESFPFMLIGNKIDLCSNQQMEVAEDEAAEWCKTHGAVAHAYVSAKDAINVDAAFHLSASRALAHAASH